MFIDVCFKIVAAFGAALVYLFFSMIYLCIALTAYVKRLFIKKK